MTKKGFGDAIIQDKVEATLPYSRRWRDPSYHAIRGREQQMVDFWGGAKSEGGTSGNTNRAVGPKYIQRMQYKKESIREFGWLTPSFGWKRN